MWDLEVDSDYHKNPLDSIFKLKVEQMPGIDSLYKRHQLMPELFRLLIE